MDRFKYNPDSCHAFANKIDIEIAKKLRIFWLLFTTLFLFACTTLPKPEMKTLTLAYEPHPESQLAVVSRNFLEDIDDGISGFFKLFRNDDAMRWRLLLADMAEETLDIQYFIWKGDT